MTNSDFCWWLHGFLEIQKPACIDEQQTNEIKNHLDLVLNPKPIQSNNRFGNLIPATGGIVYNGSLICNSNPPLIC